MLEQLRYKNHMNEVFEFGKNGIFVDMNELHDYEWTVTKRGNRISSLDYSISKRKLPVTIICDTEEKGIAARNKLFEVTEKDVLAMEHGQIMIGDYYFKCYVTRSQKKEYLISKRYMKLELTLTSDFPYWVKESQMPFGLVGDLGTGINYPFDFAFDYGSPMAKTELINPDFVPSNFRLIIYGACTDPAITIGGHTYQVYGTVETNEYLTIDSTTKKIYLTANDGTKTNKFNDRNKKSYIFEKIPTGQNSVTWEGDFGFGVILLEERSEPRWT